MDLLRLLENYTDTAIPMHMPGHKRNAALAPYLAALGARFDITEIDGFDNLHDARGILREGMERTAALWGSRRAFWLVNGSTVGILAAVHATVPMGGKVVMARGCHKSVYNALSLRRAEAVYCMPHADAHTGIHGALTPEAVTRALDMHPDARLVIVTSPTYEGAVADLPAICDAAHARGALVLVDEAHGAHLGFGHGFPDGAVKAGADIVVQSLHKTLPSLTQTAVLHLCGDRCDEHALRDALAIFETSSPSYLLMASISGCVSLLECGDALFAAWERNLQSFYRRMSELKHLYVLIVPGRDPSKIVVLTDRASMTGAQLADKLRQYRIEPEMAAGCHIVAMTGMGDTSQNLEALASALIEIDKEAHPGQSPAFPPPVLPNRALPPWEAVEKPHMPLPLEKAAGRISAEAVWAYPPGIPLILPGEILSPEIIALMARYHACGVPLHSTKDAMPRAIHVLSDSFLTK